MGVTSIEWADFTFNPWRGCSKVSAGCKNCYAEAGSKRNPGVLGVWGPNGTRVVAAESTWAEVDKWDLLAAGEGEHRRVFVASLADVFEDWPGPMVTAKGLPYWWCYGSLSNSPVPSTGMPDGCRLATMQDVRDRLFQTIDDCPDLDFLLVTKRPENVRRMWPGGRRRNVWLLTSVEDQEAADRRVPELLRLGDLSPVLGLSMEPLLGPVDLRKNIGGTLWMGGQRGHDGRHVGDGSPGCPRVPHHHHDDRCLPGLDWVIVGGESGPGARPCDLRWVRSIVDQCKSADVAVFVKQLGARPQQSSPYIEGEAMAISAVPLRDKKGGEPSEWPAGLRVREFPAPAPTQEADR